MTFTIKVQRDDEAGVWLATSEDVPGLVVEAETLSLIFAEIALVLPDLLELNQVTI